VITPVSLEGSEIYAILRKRLFAELPSEEEIDEVAIAYAEQIKLAEDSGYLTARSLEQVADGIRETYPFHPSFKHLVALFKDNPNFRETRGLLQFAARVVRSVWQRSHNDVYLGLAE
jgi:predicted AAA+ superfamily ATPase